MVAAADLVAFASASMPDADTGISGGAIDLDRRIDFTQLAANDDIEVISANAGDTQNCTIEARNAAGQIVSETKALTGTAAAIFSNLGVVERVLKVELASDAIGIITVRRSVAGATVRTIPVGERGFMMIFRKCASSGAQEDFYCKLFWKNTHGSGALLSALVKQNADPQAKLTHALADNVNDTASLTNRKTAPDGTGDLPASGAFDDADKAVPGTDLAAGAAVGVWLRLRLSASDPAFKDTYTSELAGQST